MTNGGGKHPKKAQTKRGGKPAKKSAADLSREQLTKALPKPGKSTS